MATNPVGSLTNSHWWTFGRSKTLGSKRSASSLFLINVSTSAFEVNLRKSLQTVVAINLLSILLLSPTMNPSKRYQHTHTPTGAGETLAAASLGSDQRGRPAEAHQVGVSIFFDVPMFPWCFTMFQRIMALFRPYLGNTKGTTWRSRGFRLTWKIPSLAEDTKMIQDPETLAATNSLQDRWDSHANHSAGSHSCPRKSNRVRARKPNAHPDGRAMAMAMERRSVPSFG